MWHGTAGEVREIGSFCDGKVPRAGGHCTWAAFLGASAEGTGIAAPEMEANLVEVRVELRLSLFCRRLTSVSTRLCADWAAF